VYLRSLFGGWNWCFKGCLQAVKYCEMAADRRLEEGHRAYAPLWKAN
jgi:hypothetical protein